MPSREARVRGTGGPRVRPSNFTASHQSMVPTGRATLMCCIETRGWRPKVISEVRDLIRCIRQNHCGASSDAHASPIPLERYVHRRYRSCPNGAPSRPRRCVRLPCLPTNSRRAADRLSALARNPTPPPFDGPPPVPTKRGGPRRAYVLVQDQANT